VSYSPEQVAAWIIKEFETHHGDLDTLKRMIAADLRYAYQRGREDSLPTAGIKDDK
jgi:hypothetical protein